MKMKNLATKVIGLYKKLSYPFWILRPPIVIYSSCRFYPTCSDYAVEAFSRYGFSKGLIKSLHRILRCGPFTKGGVDMA